ncbi:Craniofacial development protein 2 [Lucilia cuprina]|nr:Craniofacial development protein 2 [Lucilia cuprina]
METDKPDKMLKYRTRIGTWNVRTLLETSKLAQLCKEFAVYNLSLLGLCEVRWCESGEFTTAEGLTVLFYGKPTNELPRSSGVGLVLSKQVKRGLMGWKPHSERIITARVRGRARNITFVQCYAPTDTSENSIKESFYDLLDSVLATVHKGDIVIMMGDFNAQVGSENVNVESTMGRHGLGRLTENGKMFLETWRTNNLVIGGTLFPHPRVHKVTWVSPDCRTENQIDHITISRKWCGSLLDVRNKRGADTTY